MDLDKNYLLEKYDEQTQIIDLNEIEIYEEPFTTIKSGAFEIHGLKLKKIILIENLIAEIELDAFKELVNLEELFIVGGDLTQINQNIFNGLSNLNKLSLKENQIRRIHVNAFKHLINLKYLDLSCNELPFIDIKLLRGMKHLEELYLNGNKLKELHPKTWLSNVQANS